MKKIILFFILIISMSSYAQDWELFPKYVDLYYESVDSNAFPSFNHDIINHIVFDSSEVVGSEEKMYFGTHVQNPHLENCRSSIYSFFHFSNNYLTRRGDSIYYKYLDDSIYFLPKASPGDSWIINGLITTTVHCDSIVSDSVFGQSDSIKYFHLSGGFNNAIYKLSKHHGFIRFIPFLDYFINNLPHHSTLMGYRDSLNQYGFQMPVFEDYFPYQAGDILKWNYYYFDNVAHVQYEEFYRDSITSVSTFTDSITIVFDRIKVDAANQMTFIPGQSVTYTRQEEGGLLEAEPNDIAYFHEPLFDLYDTELSIHQDTVQNDSYYKYSFNSEPFWFNNTSCSVIWSGPGTGYSRTYEYTTRFGLTRDYFRGPHSDYTETTLIGATLGGMNYGNPDLQVGINELSKAESFIYPNPAFEKLYITKSNRQIEKIMVTDLTGKILLEEKYVGQQYIDINKLSAGTYFISIFNNEKQRSTNIFIKE